MKRAFYRISHSDTRHRVLSLLILLTAIACSTQNDQPTPTRATTISQQEAVQIALLIARQGGVEIESLAVTPASARAELTTLSTAYQRLTGDDALPVGEHPDTLVWLVTMEGLWTDAFPRPTGLSTPEPFYHFAVIIEANTGHMKLLSASP